MTKDVVVKGKKTIASLSRTVKNQKIDSFIANCDDSAYISVVICCDRFSPFKNLALLPKNPLTSLVQL